ncbi:MAG: YcgN family cysteine cluster protein, partial [Beijerinckiaceae bacterium]|nr:YcgN family cysteine cluster protein [Beijerinckiaceae bacterium]
MPPSQRITPAKTRRAAQDSTPPRQRRSEGAAKPKLGAELPFWKQKKLQDLTLAEWESLCDGCGRCCLVKLEDEDNGQVYFTNIACKLLDTSSCRCADYAHRGRRVRDCIRLTPEKVQTLSWLPPSCAYRLV